MVNPPSARVRLPRALVAECLAYDRCVKTDEPAVDKVALAWPSNGLVRRLGPSAVALTLGRPLSSLLLSTPVPQGEVSAVLLWSTGERPPRLEVPVGPTVTAALHRLRLAVCLWMALALGALLLTGSLALAAVPLGVYVAYRRYVLWRYWIRCRGPDRGDLEFRDVSNGFRAHVDAIVQAAGERHLKRPV